MWFSVSQHVFATSIAISVTSFEDASRADNVTCDPFISNFSILDEKSVQNFPVSETDSMSKPSKRETVSVLGTVDPAGESEITDGSRPWCDDCSLRVVICNYNFIKNINS